MNFMKKLVLNAFMVVALVASCTVVSAQTSGAVQRVNAPYILPQSGVRVTLKVAYEKIEKGPYARFAQQYLGVNAPLSDKVSYTIVSGSLSGFTEGDASNVYMVSDTKAVPLEVVGMEMEFDNAPKAPATNIVSDINAPLFSDLSITPIVYQTGSVDRMATKEKSIEEMALDAANTIFTLRKRRFDLITGESSENAFGAGLGAAIDEMKRIENEYLALFTGKKRVEVKEYVFDVVPKAAQNNYVVCRFTKENGIVDATDMSGEPILVVVTPEGNVKPVGGKPVAASKGSVTYRIADMANCKLFNSQDLLESKRLPILQYGATVDVMPR